MATTLPSAAPAIPARLEDGTSRSQMTRRCFAGLAGFLQNPARRYSFRGLLDPLASHCSLSRSGRRQWLCAYKLFLLLNVFITMNNAMCNKYQTRNANCEVSPFSKFDDLESDIIDNRDGCDFAWGIAMCAGRYAVETSNILFTDFMDDVDRVKSMFGYANPLHPPGNESCLMAIIQGYLDGISIHVALGGVEQSNRYRSSDSDSQDITIWQIGVDASGYLIRKSGIEAHTFIDEIYSAKIRLSENKDFDRMMHGFLDGLLINTALQAKSANNVPTDL
ncbi:hypothetical protein RP726_05265 [Candidatus Methylospira mobilis]|uniref:hypothetical protein n=1 Tax=Candidatus Methylospira mobilis TaxID=1808979 RepID=UPI0028ECCCC2|nr:hypothetical protein [Candidatus Methylospira mobilis]WNV05828.1 hypothetical protein RP726_05265 [Candidatus Methylospira mobilis]